jgi:hypothetical protein
MSKNEVKIDLKMIIYEELNDYEGKAVNHIADPSARNFVISTTKDGQKSSKNLPILTKIETFLKNAFLPEGYPHSVSKDYLTYQIWDTLQAFASSISGALATQVFFYDL